MVARGALVGDRGPASAPPPGERLRDGVRVVIAGPPNIGKSSLLNVLAGREAAITPAVAGTTRDLVEAPTAIGGAPFPLVDPAGPRATGDANTTLRDTRARPNTPPADTTLLPGPSPPAPAPPPPSRND